MYEFQCYQSLMEIWYTLASGTKEDCETAMAWYVENRDDLPENGFRVVEVPVEA